MRYDVVVAGAGVGGICATLAAARLDCRVLLIERMDEIGGTGVHSPVGLVCKFRDHAGKPINNGIHRELFPQAYRNIGLGEEKVPVYDERELKAAYERLLAAEPLLTVWTGTELKRATVRDGRIVSLEVRGKHSGVAEADVFLDGTADGNLAALAGASFQKGRDQDGKMQSATLTFKMTGFDTAKLAVPDITTWRGNQSLWKRELTPYYLKMKEAGKTSNGRNAVGCFPYPDGKGVLFNSTAIADADPTDPASMERAMAEGRKQVTELIEAIREHPAFASAQVEFVSTKLGVREGRRIVGDYMLTAEDCLSARKFDDMVAACAYSIDIHEPEGNKTTMKAIPSPGYYHIPYRSLIAQGFANLLLSSRCISGTFEAHSSYRVMSGVSAIGEAAGTAAAIMARTGAKDSRDVSAANIRFLRQTRGQFVEGDVEPIRLFQ